MISPVAQSSRGASAIAQPVSPHLPAAVVSQVGATRRRVRRVPPIASPWIRAQELNVSRHAAALRPFLREEFGTDASTPTDGHIQAVNQLMGTLQAKLGGVRRRVKGALRGVSESASSERLQRLMREKSQAHVWVQAIERVWDFYFELFGQRQSRFGDWLLSCDRIALDCYQHVYLGLGVAKSIPAPPPFAYMRTGFSPATFRRGIPLRRLGRLPNPFPLVQIPYHRLVNPWTLGAVLHEVSHNLQNELGLARQVPLRIARTLLRGGFGQQVALTWSRWNRELFADLSGLLLGGPAVVASLMDVVARSPEVTLAYNPRAPHPTPYLRTFMSVELLRRMGFPREAEAYRRLWMRIYPDPRLGGVPNAILDTFQEANTLVIDAVCFQPFKALGNRSLAQVIRFAPKEQQMIEEAAGRLTVGTDPGIVPERFLIGATRLALDNRLASPATIAERFYRELARR